MAVVMLNNFVKEIVNYLTPKALLKILQSSQLHGEDYKALLNKPESKKYKMDMDDCIIDYHNFRFDNEGNILADTTKYGSLKNYDDDQLHFVVRAFINDRQQLKIVAIDVKYE